jgi:hypothetical protein
MVAFFLPRKGNAKGGRAKRGRTHFGNKLIFCNQTQKIIFIAKMSPSPLGIPPWQSPLAFHLSWKSFLVIT